MLKITLILFGLAILTSPSFLFAEETNSASKLKITKINKNVSSSTPQSMKSNSDVNPRIIVTLDDETRNFFAKQSDGIGLKDWVVAFIGLFGALLGSMMGGRYTRKATIDGVAATFKNETLKKEKSGIEDRIALLQSLLDEISTLFSIFEAGSGGILITINTEAENINDRFFNNYFAASCNYFCIFDSSAERIGSFTNERLRLEIIATYTKSKSLVDSLLLYNMPLQDLNNWRIFNINHPNYLQIFDERVVCLIQNTNRLKAQAIELKSKVENLKINLQEEIEALKQELATMS